MNSKIVSLVGVVAVLSLMMLCVDANNYKPPNDKTGQSCDKDSDCCDHNKKDFVCVKSTNSWFSIICEFLKKWTFWKNSGFPKQGICLKCDDVKSICSSHVQSWNYHGYPESNCYWLKCKCGMGCPGTTTSTTTPSTTTTPTTPTTPTTTTTPTTPTTTMTDPTEPETTTTVL